MATSGVTGSSLPPGDDALIRRIQMLERRVDELGPGLMAAITPAINNLTTAQANITALIGSEVAVTSIPVHTATNFATPAGGNTIESTRTITVPSGFTTAIVMANAFATVVNSGGSAMNLQVNPGIDGSLGPGNLDRGVPAGGVGMVDASAVQSITGLSAGATFDVVVWITTTTACAANYGNQAMVSGVILWVR